MCCTRRASPAQMLRRWGPALPLGFVGFSPPPPVASGYRLAVLVTRPCLTGITITYNCGCLSIFPPPVQFQESFSQVLLGGVFSSCTGPLLLGLFLFSDPLWSSCLQYMLFKMGAGVAERPGFLGKRMRMRRRSRAACKRHPLARAAAATCCSPRPRPPPLPPRPPRRLPPAAAAAARQPGQAATMPALRPRRLPPLAHRWVLGSTVTECCIRTLPTV